MRALIDIEERDLRALDHLAKSRNRSRAALIREAVAAYLKHQSPAGIDDAFGLWGERQVDGLAYQEKIRAEW
jgi:predicted transcriptional regulator